MDTLDLMGIPFIFDQCEPGLTEYAGGRYLRFDFMVYYGKAVIVIEFDGGQHKAPATFGGVSAERAAELFERTVESDRIKNEYCAAMGYRLLRIDADDRMRTPRIIGDFFRERLGWSPGPLPADTPAIPRAPPARARQPRLNLDGLVEGFVRGTFDVLGIDPSTGTASVEPTAFQHPAALDLAIKINHGAYLAFGNKSGSRRNQCLTEPSSVGKMRQVLVSTIGRVLKHVGGRIQPVYDTARMKKQGRPSRFKMTWDVDLVDQYMRADDGPRPI